MLDDYFRIRYKKVPLAVSFQDSNTYITELHNHSEFEILLITRGENYGLKALSPVMIMMSTAQVMESTGINCEKYRRIARKTAREVLKGGFLNDDVGALLKM